MLQVTNLSYVYGPESSLTFPDWEVEKQEHAVIIGPSGGGKTTLLHLLGGLLMPTSGQVNINGIRLDQLSSSKLDRFRGMYLGFVFQKPHLIPSLSVEENLKLATFFAKKSHMNDRIATVLSDLGIQELAGRSIHEISQGQAQRVAIARAVINEPDIIFGDEPTASLDDNSCTAVIDLLKDQAQRCRATLIIATHDQRVKSEFQNQLVL